MLPHLKTYTAEEKEKSRILFEEGRKQRTLALKNQRHLSKEEMLAEIKHIKNNKTF